MDEYDDTGEFSDTNDKYDEFGVLSETIDEYDDTGDSSAFSDHCSGCGCSRGDCGLKDKIGPLQNVSDWLSSSSGRETVMYGTSCRSASSRVGGEGARWTRFVVSGQ